MFFLLSDHAFNNKLLLENAFGSTPINKAFDVDGVKGGIINRIAGKLLSLTHIKKPSWKRNIKSPKDIVPRREKSKINPVDLKRIDSYDVNEVKKNYYFNRELIQERIENKESSRAYLAALGSFPYLFLLGTLVRNAYSNTKIMDFNRYKDGGKWYVLPPMSTNAEKIVHMLHYGANTIDAEIYRFNQNNEDIGIALSYTFLMEKTTIPIELRNNTLYLRLSVEPRHDNVASEEIQTELLKDISYYLRTLAKPGRNIHLFVAAQASMCLNLGVNYMDNAHGQLIVYNFDRDILQHNWAVKIKNEEIEVYDTSVFSY
ncbi:SAVED domain-containing protein [Sulfurimonas sp.]|uniref:SAVED domain-containing protein n=1 Tax=Sulfurimonas sp. TaxID=2022749 RepID=UPI0019F78FFB|nr:SAVED domain-containing protein [Sulfurimonas sp.]MBE0513908.1 SAVED domain-containing protein [Sulfurimonas sp.]